MNNFKNNKNHNNNIKNNNYYNKTTSKQAGAELCQDQSCLKGKYTGFGKLSCYEIQLDWDSLPVFYF